ncbi:MAG: MFS transporter [Sporolactobacillus sp.]
MSNENRRVTPETWTVKQKNWIIAAVSLAYLMVMMDYSILNVALQTIQQHFQASNSQLQWAVVAYEIPYCSLLLPAGFLADRFGRKRILTIGLTLFLLSSCGIALSDNMEALIMWRVGMGIGGAVVPATTLAIIKNTFTSKEQSKVLGIWSAAGGASVAFGPILSGLLIRFLPWWSIFLINIPIVLCCVLIIGRYVVESVNRFDTAIDFWGSLMCITGISVLMYGLVQMGQSHHGLFDPLVSGSLLLGLILIMVLVFFETRQKDPLLALNLFKNSGFSFGTLAISCAYFALSGGTYVLVFFMQLIRHNTPLMLGLLMFPVAGGAIIGSLASARLSRSFGAKAIATAGLLIIASGFIIFSWSNQHTLVLMIEIGFLLSGVGMGLAMGATTQLTMAAVSAEKAGAGAGLTNTVRGLISIVGVGVLGTLYSMVYRQYLTNALSPSADKLGLKIYTLESLSQTRTALNHSSIVTTAKIAIRLKADDAFLFAFHTSMWTAVAVLIGTACMGLFELFRPSVK